MSCYHKLVQSKFIGNAPAELQQARMALGMSAPKPLTHSYGLGRRVKRVVYNKYLEYYELLSYPAEVSDEFYHDLHYIKVDHLLFAFSGKKAHIDNACDHSYKVNGDIPYYRTQHLINGRVFYAVLIDIRFSMVPHSPN